MFKTSRRTLLAALAVTAAAAAPSTASAMQIADLTSGPSGPAGPPIVAVASHSPQVTQPSSFDWGDAGVGAAAATVALMGAGSIALGGRRRRGHIARAS
jgi:hypothetical protein